MTLGNGMQLEIKLKKVHDPLYAYKRLNFVPRRFDKFEYVPSVGASGGILVVWNSSLFTVKVLDLQTFPISIAFLLFIMEILGTSLLYMALIIYMMMKTGFFIVI
jgi:hypothetical protein